MTTKRADLRQRLGIQGFQVEFNLKFGFHGTDHFQNADRVNHASLEEVIVVRKRIERHSSGGKCRRIALYQKLADLS